MNRRRFLRGSLATAAAAAIPGQPGLAAILGPAPTVTADINAVTGAGAEVTLSKAAVQDLGASLRGNLLLPGHASYEEARRVINAAIDKRPALIVQPRGAADVKNAVDFARAENLLVAVKCGGHSPSGKGTCDGGMLIDLSLLRSVRVDPKNRVAHVAGGSLLGDMDHDAMAFGLVTTAGTVSHTGVGGLTLGGGFGRVARRFGLATDNVLGVDIVTADGSYLRADASENEDLYWGVRGGGGNFGVVTSFDFRLHPMQRQVVGGTIAFPFTQARQLLDFYADYTMEAPDELYLDGGLMSVPGRPPTAFFSVCYSGPPSQAEKILKDLRSAGTPVMDTLGPVDYVALQRSGDMEDPRGQGVYIKSGFATEVSAPMRRAIIDGFEPHPERVLFVAFQHAGGAIGRVPPAATAFPHRHVNYDALVIMSWPVEIDPTEHVRWQKEYWGTIEPHTDGFYTNDVGDQSRQELEENYRQNFERLLALKNKFDPTNLFRLNANIEPTV